jgi:hypothetical protein
MSLPSFSGVTKKQDDLLAKGFPFGNAFALALYHKANPVSFTAKTALAHAAATPTTKLQFGYKVGDLDLKESITEATQYKLTGEYVPPKHKDITLSGEATCGVGGPHFSLSVQQVLKQARYKLTVAESLLATLAVVAGKPEQGVGFNVAVNKDLQLKTYNAVAFLRFGQVDLALKHESKAGDALQLGNVVFSMHQQLKPKIAIAAKVTYDHTNKDKPLAGQATVRMQISDKRAVAVKALCCGTLALSHRVKLSEEVTVLTGVQANPQQLQDAQFGFKLKVNS